MLARRCRLIIASDAGYNSGASEFTALANLVTLARTELGVQFFDLDADRPLDLDRFRKRDADDGRFAPQQVLALRIRYPETGGTGPGGGPAGGPADGLLIYVQMALTGREDIDLRQARERFPNFPDEPTGNQVYTDRQVELYRRLGAHVGGVLCRNLPARPLVHAPGEAPRTGRTRVVGPADLRERLTLSFLQECATEGAVARGEVSAGRVMGLHGAAAVDLHPPEPDPTPGTAGTAAGEPRRRPHAWYFPTAAEVARRLGAADPFAGADPGAGAGGNGPAGADDPDVRTADLWLRLYDADADFRLYHNRRAWRLMRDDLATDPADPAVGVPAVPRAGLDRRPGGNRCRGTRGSLTPGHAAVLYMACATRTDLDPPEPARESVGPAAGDHERGRMGKDWQPFAAGGRARLCELVAGRFGGDRPDQRAAFLGALARHVRDAQAPGEDALPQTREDFPIPGGVDAAQRFLITVSESVAPEHGHSQIVQDYAACLYREHRLLHPAPAPAGRHASNGTADGDDETSGEFNEFDDAKADREFDAGVYEAVGGRAR